MPIRIEHQPAAGPVGMAAYMSGMGAARERKRKQLLELYKEQQRMQFQVGLQERGFQHATGMQEARDVAAMERLEVGEAGAMDRAEIHEAGAEERRRTADEARQREADIEHRRRTAEGKRKGMASGLDDTDASRQHRAQFNDLADEIANIEGSRHIKESDKDKLIALLEAQQQVILDKNPVVTKEERLRKAMGDELYERHTAAGSIMNINKETGDVSFARGQPELPKVTQRKEAKEQAEQAYTDAVAARQEQIVRHNAEQAARDAHVKRLFDEGYYKWSEIQDKLNEDLGPPKYEWPEPLSRSDFMKQGEVTAATQGGQGGGQQRGGYDPSTKTITLSPVNPPADVKSRADAFMAAQQGTGVQGTLGGATQAGQAEEAQSSIAGWDEPAFQPPAGATPGIPAGAVDLGDGTYLHNGKRYGRHELSPQGEGGGGAMPEPRHFGGGIWPDPSKEPTPQGGQEPRHRGGETGRGMNSFMGRDGTTIKLSLRPGGEATLLHLIQMPNESDEEFAERWKGQGWHVETTSGAAPQPSGQQPDDGMGALRKRYAQTLEGRGYSPSPANRPLRKKRKR